MKSTRKTLAFVLALVLLAAAAAGTTLAVLSKEPSAGVVNTFTGRNPLTSPDIEVDPLPDVVYDATQHKPALAEVKLYDTSSGSRVQLTPGMDYELVGYGPNASMTDTACNINVADGGSVTVRGLGDYWGNREVTFNIIKAPLTVTADDQTVTYGDPVPSYTYTISGFKGSDTASVVSGSPALSSPYTTTTAVGTYAITCADGSPAMSAANYSFSFVNGTLTVNKVQASAITIDPLPNYEYDATAKTPAMTVKYGSKVLTEGTDYDVSYAGTDNVNVGVVHPVVTLKGNYEGTLNPTFNITKAPLVVTADDKNVSYGSPVPTYTYTITGFKGSDTASVVTGTPSLTCAYTATTAVGEYPIDCADGTPALYAANYSFTFVNGKLTVSAAGNVTIDPLPNYQYDATAKTPSMTVKCGSTLLTEGIDYDVSYTGTDNVNVGTVHPTVTLKGNYAGTLYPTFNITKATLTVTADNKAVTYGDPVPAYTYKITGFKGSDTAAVVSGTPSLSSPYTTATAAGTYTITCADGSPAMSAANYNFNFVNGTLTVNKVQASAITIDPLPNYEYDATAKTPAMTVKYGSKELTEGTDYDVSYASTDNVNVGTVRPVVTLKGNYQGTLNPTFQITKAQLTVTADNKSISYRDPAPTFTYTITGFKGSDTAATSNITGTPSLSSSYTTSSNVGNYPIVCADGSPAMSSPNYTFRFVNGSLAVGTKQATVDPLPNYEYDATAKTPTITVRSGSDVLVEGTDYDVSYAGTDNVNVGTVEPTVTLKGNYSGTLYPTFQITKAQLTVTADNKAVTYGDPVPAYTYTITGFKGSDTAATSNITGTPALSCPYTTTTPAGTQTITCADSTPAMSAPNYTFRFDNGTLTINKVMAASITIDPLPNYQYDATAKTPAMTVKYGSKVLTEGTDYDVSYAGTDNVHVGTVHPVVTLKGNYQGTLNPTFNITKAVLTVTADNKACTYGDAAPAYTYRITGYEGSDTASVVTGTPTLGCAYAVMSNAGPYTITCADGSPAMSAHDYSFQFVNGTLTVDKYDLANCTFETVPDQEHTGTAITPTPAISVPIPSGSTTVVPTADYGYSYADNIDEGTATITVTAEPDSTNYKGTNSTTFLIINSGVKLTYDPNGADAAYNAHPIEYNRVTVPDEELYEKNATVVVKSLIKAPEGYEFLGWSTNPRATTPEYVEDDEITMTANVTLYAIWADKFILTRIDPCVPYAYMCTYDNSRLYYEDDGQYTTGVYVETDGICPRPTVYGINLRERTLGGEPVGERVAIEHTEFEYSYLENKHVLDPDAPLAYVIATNKANENNSVFTNFEIWDPDTVDPFEKGDCNLELEKYSGSTMYGTESYTVDVILDSNVPSEYWEITLSTDSLPGCDGVPVPLVVGENVYIESPKHTEGTGIQTEEGELNEWVSTSHTLVIKGIGRALPSDFTVTIHVPEGTFYLESDPDAVYTHTITKRPVMITWNGQQKIKYDGLRHVPDYICQGVINDDPLVVDTAVEGGNCIDPGEYVAYVTDINLRDRYDDSATDFLYTIYNELPNPDVEDDIDDGKWADLFFTVNGVTYTTQRQDVNIPGIWKVTYDISGNWVAYLYTDGDFGQKTGKQVEMDAFLVGGGGGGSGTATWYEEKVCGPDLSSSSGGYKRHDSLMDAMYSLGWDGSPSTIANYIHEPIVGEQRYLYTGGNMAGRYWYTPAPPSYNSEGQLVIRIEYKAFGEGGSGGAINYADGLISDSNVGYHVTVGDGGRGGSGKSNGGHGGSSSFDTRTEGVITAAGGRGGDLLKGGYYIDGEEQSTGKNGDNGYYAYDDQTYDGIMYGAGGGDKDYNWYGKGGLTTGGDAGKAGQEYGGGGGGANASGGKGIVVVQNTRRNPLIKEVAGNNAKTVTDEGTGSTLYQVDIVPVILYGNKPFVYTVQQVDTTQVLTDGDGVKYYGDLGGTEEFTARVPRIRVTSSTPTATFRLTVTDKKDLVGYCYFDCDWTTGEFRPRGTTFSAYNTTTHFTYYTGYNMGEYNYYKTTYNTNGTIASRYYRIGQNKTLKDDGTIDFETWIGQNYNLTISEPTIVDAFVVSSGNKGDNAHDSNGGNGGHGGNGVVGYGFEMVSNEFTTQIGTRAALTNTSTNGKLSTWTTQDGTPYTNDLSDNTSFRFGGRGGTSIDGSSGLGFSLFLEPNYPRGLVFSNGGTKGGGSWYDHGGYAPTMPAGTTNSGYGNGGGGGYAYWGGNPTPWWHNDPGGDGTQGVIVIRRVGSSPMGDADYIVSVIDTNKAPNKTRYYMTEDPSCTTCWQANQIITQDYVPESVAGYVFQNVNEKADGTGDAYTNREGEWTAPLDFGYNKDLYAYYSVFQFIDDMADPEYRVKRVLQEYGEPLPDLQALTHDTELGAAFRVPYVAGYTFDGYYDEPNGQGNRFYNADLELVYRDPDTDQPVTVFEFDEDLVLYAAWKTTGPVAVRTDSGMLIIKYLEDECLLPGTFFTDPEDQQSMIEEVISLPDDMSASTSPLAGRTDFNRVYVDESAQDWQPTDLKGMFKGCPKITAVNGLATIDTSECISFESMFEDCEKLESVEIDGIDTSSLESVKNMFKNDKLIESLDMSSWNTGSLTNAGGMCYGCTGLTEVDVSTWDTSSLDTTESMFNGCTGLTKIDVLGWNVESLTSTGSMFYGDNQITVLDLSTWNPRSLLHSPSMFAGMSALTTIYADTWNPISDSGAMFSGDTNLKGAIVYNGSYLTSVYANPNTGYFTGKAKALLCDDGCLYFVNDTVPYVVGDTYGDAAISSIFPVNNNSSRRWYGNAAVTSIEVADSFADVSLSNLAQFFHNLPNLTTISGLENLDTSRATAMDYMFCSDPKLGPAIDISMWETGNVTNFYYMFYNCPMLKEVTLGAIDMSHATNVTGMFSLDTSLERIYTKPGMDFWQKDTAITGAQNMFGSCSTKLVGAKQWVSNDYQNTNYANTRSGYFMSKEGAHAFLRNNGTLELIYSDTAADYEAIIADAVWKNPAMETEPMGIKAVVALPSVATDYQSTRVFATEVLRVVVDDSMSKFSMDSTYAWFHNFNACTEYVGLGNLDMSGVTDTRLMFYNNASLRYLDLRGWDTTLIRNTVSMFQGDSSLMCIFVDGDWNAAVSANSGDTFAGCTSIRGGEAYNNGYRSGLRCNEAGYFIGRAKALVCSDGGIYCVYDDNLYLDGDSFTNDAGTELTINAVMGIGNSWRELNDYTHIFRDTGSVVYHPFVEFEDSFAGYRLRPDMSYWFYDCEGLTELRKTENVDTSELVNANYMFESCIRLQVLDLSTWDMSSLQNAARMFYGCTNLTTIYGGNWTAQATRLTDGNSGDMFAGSTLLHGAITYNGSWVNRNYANPLSGYFVGGSNTPKAVLLNNGTLRFVYPNDTHDVYSLLGAGITADDVVEIYEAPMNVSGTYPPWQPRQSSITRVVFDESFARATPQTTYRWFRGCTNLTRVEGTENLNTSMIRSMEEMFYECTSLTGIDLSTWDLPSSDVYTTNMFRSCSSLKVVYLDNWTDTLAGKAGSMFTGCTQLPGYNGDIADHRAANCNTGFTVGKAKALLCDDNCLYFDYSDDKYYVGDTYKGHTVTAAYSASRTSATSWQSNSSITAAEFDENFYEFCPKTTYQMFYGNTGLTEIRNLNYLNMSNVGIASYMFYNCQQLTSLDLSSWDVSSLMFADSMFRSCTRLTTIYGTDWRSDAPNLTIANSPNMFASSTALRGAINYDSSKLTSRYANPVDGYFTGGGIKTYFDDGTIPGYTVYDHVTMVSGGAFDAQVIPTDVTTEMQVFEPTFISAASWFGTAAGSNNYHFTDYSNKYYWGRSGAESNAGTWTSQPHNLKFNYGPGKAVILDGTTLGSGSAITSASSLFIGGRSATTNLWSGDIYYIKIYDRTTLTPIRNFVPAKETGSGSIGFYDTVSGTFFASAGASGEMPSQTSATGAYLAAVDVPQREGYSFLGYYSQPNGQGTKYINADGSPAAAVDYATGTTLYAYWEAAVKVTFADFVTDGTTYVRADHLHLTNGATIPTDITATTQITMQTKFMVENGTNIIVGTSGANPKLALWINTDKNMYLDYGHTDYRIGAGGYAYGGVYDMEVGNVYIKNLGSGMTQASSVYRSYTINKPISIFPDANLTGDIYYLNLFSGSTMVRNMLAYRTTGGTYGMYDTVSNTFIQSTGTAAEGVDYIVCVPVNTSDFPGNVTVPVREGYVFEGYYTQPDGQGTKYISSDGSPVAGAPALSADTMLYANWTMESGGVIAILDTAGNMEIRTADRTYAIGSSYTNAHGENVTVSKVYNVPDYFHTIQGSTPWYNDRTSIRTVYFDESLLDAYHPTSLCAMFMGCTNLTYVYGTENLDATYVQTMESMFNGCTSLETVDLRFGGDPAPDTMTYMFYNCPALKVIYSNVNYVNVTNKASVFNSCTSLTGNKRFNTSHITGDYARYDAEGYFVGKQKVIDCDNNCLYFVNDDVAYRIGDTYKGHVIRDVYGIALSSSESLPWIGNTTATSVEIEENFRSFKPVTMLEWFYGLSNVTEFRGLENIDTARVADMRHLFRNVSSAATADTRFILDLSTWDTGSLTMCDYMFYNTRYVYKIYVGDGWNMTGITSGGNVFYHNYGLVGEGSAFPKSGDGTANYTYANAETGYLSKHTIWGLLGANGNLTIKYWDEPNAYLPVIGETYTDNLGSTTLADYYGIQYLNVNNFNRSQDTTAVTSVHFDESCQDAPFRSMYQWFYHDTALASVTGLENINTSSLVYTNRMFAGDTALTSLDFSSWHVPNLTDTVYMFNGCTNLTTIYGGDWTSEANNLTDAKSDGMFTNCTRLIGAISYNASYVNRNFANPYTGYFTGQAGGKAILYADGEFEILYADSFDAIASRKSSGGADISKVYAVAKTSGDNRPWVNDWASVLTVRVDESASNIELTGLYGFFSGFSNCTEITGLNYLDTSNVDNFGNMFYNCRSLVGLDLRGWDFSSVTNISNMFYNCTNLGVIYCDARIPSSSAAVNSTGVFYKCTRLSGPCGFTDSTDGYKGVYFDNARGYITNRAKGLQCDDSCCYFVYDDVAYYPGDTYKGHTINAVHGIPYDGLISGNPTTSGMSVTAVQFEESYRSYKPTYIGSMFWNCYYLHEFRGMENWDVSAVINASNVFYNTGNTAAVPYDLDLSHWRTSAFTNINNLFYGNQYVRRIYVGDGWDIGNVTSTGDVFYNNKNLVGSYSEYYHGTSKLNKTFADTDHFLTPFTLWAILGTNNNLTYKYDPAPAAFTPVIGETYTDNLGTTTVAAFYPVSFNTTVGYNNGTESNSNIHSVYFDPSMRAARIAGTAGWLNGNTALTSVAGTENFNMSTVVDSYAMFQGCTGLTTLDLSSWSTPSLRRSESMFNGCTNLTTIYGGNWTAQATGLTDSNSANMFTNCTKLIGAIPYNSSQVNRNYANAYSGYFTTTNGARAVLYTDGEMEMLYTSDVTTLQDRTSSGGAAVSRIFQIPVNLQGGLPSWSTSSSSITRIVIDPSMSSVNLGTTLNMFNGLSGCTEITGLANLNMSGVTSAQNMFYGCTSLTHLDIRGWDLRSLTNITGMFFNCSSLQTIYSDAVLPDSSPCRTNAQVFQGCTNLAGVQAFSAAADYYKGDEFDYEKGYLINKAKALLCSDNCLYFVYDDNAYYAGDTYNSLTINAVYGVPGPNAGGTVRGTPAMTYNSLVQAVEITDSFYSYKPTTIAMWFAKNPNLHEFRHLENIDTSNVTDMRVVFYEIGNTSQVTFDIDISGWNTSSVTKMEGMFGQNKFLNHIYVGSGWNTASVNDNGVNMFINCTRLVGAIAYNASYTTVAYANTTTGYLSLASLANNSLNLNP